MAYPTIGGAVIDCSRVKLRAFVSLYDDVALVGLRDSHETVILNLWLPIELWEGLKSGNDNDYRTKEESNE